MSAYLSTFQTITANDPLFAALVAEGAPYPTSETWISLAVTRLNAERWDDLHVQAVCYLAAHMYAVGPGRASSGGAGLGGAVAERRARNWAIRYQSTGSVSSTSDASLRETSYGLEFLSLRAMTRRPALARPSRT